MPVGRAGRHVDGAGLVTWVKAVPFHAGERWPAIFAEVMTRPGEWALVREYRPGTGSANRMAKLIRRGDYRTQPPGRWEAKARANQLYIRYLGPGGSRKGAA